MEWCEVSCFALIYGDMQVSKEITIGDRVTCKYLNVAIFGHILNCFVNANYTANTWHPTLVRFSAQG